MKDLTRDLKEKPLRTCMKHGLQIGLPPKLKTYRDPIFDFVPLPSKEGPRRVVEIGTLQGWLAWRIMKYLPDAQLVCVDPHNDDQGEYNKRCWKKNLEPFEGERVALWAGESEHMAKLWPCCWEIDWLFIDGDHSEEAVYVDLKSWYPLVRSGGLVSGHDISGVHGPAVGAALHRFMSEMGIETPYSTGKVYSFTGKQITECWWFFKG